MPRSGRSGAAWGRVEHPLCEGPELLDRLLDAPGHGVIQLSAAAGIHVDSMAERWPGWTVEF
ncbi:hypothetical protein [Streptacidiphilus jiangxiensis]|uniref:hypothetical protein n=1 Tax=Streptacidiphilus jiangxiensis TaxID=235985 RepID=UPI0005A65A50|nr:hypothetical protein [Streptacidiphilus jiangxiensis]